MMSFVISIVSILIFSGLIAYDNQLIKRFTTVPMVRLQMDGQYLWRLVFTWISLTYSWISCDSLLDVISKKSATWLIFLYPSFL